MSFKGIKGLMPIPVPKELSPDFVEGLLQIFGDLLSGHSVTASRNHIQMLNTDPPMAILVIAAIVPESEIDKIGEQAWNYMASEIDKFNAEEKRKPQ